MSSAKKTLRGEVVGSSRNKTAIVKVTVEKRHPRYHKKYMITKRYQVHDEQGISAVGDKVTIEETRPRSATKHWRIV